MAASDAHALPGTGDPKVHVEGLFGGEGSLSGRGDGGMGGGARAGVTLFGVYGGLTATYLNRGGSSAEMFPSTDTTMSSWAVAAEFGYDFALPITATLRPYVGLGDQIYKIESIRNSDPPVALSTSTHRFYAAPGATLLFQPFGPLELGLDFRFVLPVRTGNDNADRFAYGLYGTAGVAF